MNRTLVLLLPLILFAGCGREQLDITAMDDETLLKKMSDVAFQKMDDANDDLAKVEEPYRTVAIIYAAQGVIENGGLMYFFENDWPRTPPYGIYADAYERIGRLDAAKAIRDAAQSFGIDNPERYIDQRRQYMERHYNEDTHCVDGWHDCIYDDEQVWADLATWVRNFRRS